MRRPHLIYMIIAIGISAKTASAEPPVVQSNTPVIYLADNLDEKDRLGWCIDTEGRGFAETLQSHSCKEASRGVTDTQFLYDPMTGQIRSVPFADKCMTLSDPDNPVWPFGLLDCVDGEVTQAFFYDPGTMEIRIGTDPTKCVIVASESIAAGPYMSRDLIFADCDAIDAGYKQWVVRN